MKLKGFDQMFKLKVPGKHLVLDAAAAVALAVILAKKEFGSEQPDSASLKKMAEALESFSGSRRRSEIIGSVNGILFMDDYAHHPTAIKTTLEGLKAFYPKRRIVVSFMSHTYSRTAALLEEFASSFSSADILLLHKIYASAREEYHGGVNGETLFEHTKKYKEKQLQNSSFVIASDKKNIFRSRKAGNCTSFGKTNRVLQETQDVYYFDEPIEAKDFLLHTLKPGDLFISMGAGDNWKLGKAVFETLKENANGEHH